jgi:tetratricopeptide (TPR) repeat protein
MNDRLDASRIAALTRASARRAGVRCAGERCVAAALFVFTLAATSAVSLATTAAPVRAQQPPAQQTPEDAPSATMLRMRDGSIQWGTIANHDPDGITFVRIENAGQVRVPWSVLHPEQEKELRLKYGYVDLSSDEVMFEADRLVLVDGSEVIGLIIDRTPDTLIVKRAGTTAIVPKNRISAASTTALVPALELYTKEELYNRELSNTNPNDAESNFKLGEYCERIFDFAHAGQHYKRAQELDAKFRPDDVRVAIVRAEEKSKAQVEIDYLSQVELLLSRKKYDEALARADAFKEKFPESLLLPDAKRKHDRIVKARERDLTDHIMNSWYTWAGRIAHEASLKMTHEQALAYLDEGMKRDILDKVTKDAQRISKEASSDNVRKMWLARHKVRWYHASYGLGTYLLGKEAALKGEQSDAPKQAPTNEKDKARADLADKIARYMQNQEMARKAQSKQEQSDDREAIWKDMGAGGRTQWILAYYAENSGDMENSKKPMLDNCHECGGTGTREVVVSGSNAQKSTKGGKDSSMGAIECPACHGLGRIRRISYR